MSPSSTSVSGGIYLDEYFTLQLSIVSSIATLLLSLLRNTCFLNYGKVL